VDPPTYGNVAVLLDEPAVLAGRTETAIEAFQTKTTARR
jgi:hypothetical protein